ncbi:MAG: hypothetical protein HQL51_14225 [Magnetococcales bacterium]|nr:hypothetical protein [Magnetococcales bacterium]
MNVNDTDPLFLSRRQLLAAGVALGLGTVAEGTGMAWAAEGGVPEQGFRDLQGAVRVNGQPARVGQILQSGDMVETGDDGTATLVSGSDALLLRHKTMIVATVRTGGVADRAVEGLKLLQGGVLAVFGLHPAKIETSVAVMGIRGTGLYIEADPQGQTTYCCACYGAVDVTPEGSKTTKALAATHHQACKVQYAPTGARVSDETLLNHTDEELTRLESLVFRKPPFAPAKG